MTEQTIEVGDIVHRKGESGKFSHRKVVRIHPHPWPELKDNPENNVLFCERLPSGIVAGTPHTAGLMESIDKAQELIKISEAVLVSKGSADV